MLTVLACIISCLYLIAHFPVLTVAQENAAGRGFIVKGRVVDRYGKPVIGAGVTFLPADQEITENIAGSDLITEYSTNRDGKFSIKGENDQYQYWTLVTTPPPDHASQQPVSPPFETLKHNLKTHYPSTSVPESTQFESIRRIFAGKLVNVKAGTEIDLGDIPIQVEYSQARLHLSCSRRGYQFRIRDAWGDFVTDGMITARSSCNKDHDVIFSLPPGRWYVGVSNIPSKRWLEASVSIPLHVSPTIIEVAFDREQKSSLVVPATNRNSEAAYKALTEMAFGFSGDVFVARAERCNLEVVQLFLQTGMSSNEKGEEGRTALMGAIHARCQAVAEMLLKDKADVNEKDNYGNTALHIAAIVADEEIINSLTQAGAHVDEQNIFGETPLVFAVLSGRANIVEALIHLGANVNVKDREGKTVLQEAGEHSPKIRELLERARAKR
ncbi:MAG TPA: ankyrin repeat domain-containing protein [Blastocatellia bacterium]|nr:ankyrin repeat domain-containing protein [Blastocatellia bacterium]